MRVALAQMNARVGDFAGNLAKARDFLARARAGRADVAVFPEFTLVGYPPRDLLLRGEFVGANLRALADFAGSVTGGIHAVVGYAEPNTGPAGKPLRNALALVGDGKVLSRHYKRLLPTYDVFDEARYFEPAPPPGATDVATVAGRPVGITICEDIWCESPPPAAGEPCLYHSDPVADLVGRPVDWVVNISASPYGIGKPQSRPRMYGRQARRLGRPVVVVNQVGAHDDLVFDGNSCAFDAGGNVVAQCREFAEDLLVVDLGTSAGRIETPAAGEESVCRALVFGIREFVTQCGRGSVLVNLSGGVGAAVVATLAAHALGPGNVLGVALAGRECSAPLLEEARDIARRLGIGFRTLPVEAVACEAVLGGTTVDVSGAVLDALADREGRVLLSAADKSDLAVGRGDVSGALAPLADLTRTRVRRLARWVNDRFDGPIPARLLLDEPSAGEDLPDALLDRVITQYVEGERSPADMVAGGLDPADVERVTRLIDAAELKRRRGPIGLKVTPRAFGPGRRMPVAR